MSSKDFEAALDKLEVSEVHATLRAQYREACERADGLDVAESTVASLTDWANTFCREESCTEANDTDLDQIRDAIAAPIYKLRRELQRERKRADSLEKLRADAADAVLRLREQWQFQLDRADAAREGLEEALALVPGPSDEIDSLVETFEAIEQRLEKALAASEAKGGA